MINMPRSNEEAAETRARKRRSNNSADAGHRVMPAALRNPKKTLSSPLAQCQQASRVARAVEICAQSAQECLAVVAVARSDDRWMRDVPAGHAALSAMKYADLFASPYDDVYFLRDRSMPHGRCLAYPLISLIIVVHTHLPELCQYLLHDIYADHAVYATRARVPSVSWSKIIFLSLL